jgi:UDP-N-acetyl-2-amino-2-deoxyglucuronate dehydrogenase
MDKIKFAVIGCGSIGKRHIAVLDAEPMAEIVAICDIEESKCKTLSETYGGLKYYTDYREMLKNEPGIEIVNIASPHGLHAQMSIDISMAGMHSLVEKPMALNTSDCEKMIQEAASNNVKLFVVKQNRYNTPIALAKKAIDENRLGRLFMVQCNVMWNRNQEYYQESEWRGKLVLEGGALHTQVSHFIDLLIWWFGDLVEAKSIIDTLDHDIEIEDCGVSALRFKNGAIGSLLWTTCVYNKNFEGSITIIAENGTIKIGGKYLNRIEFWDVKSFPLPEDIEFEDQPNNYGKYQGTSSNHNKLIEDLVSQFIENRKGVVEGDEAKKTIQAIERIYKNAK